MHASVNVGCQGKSGPGKIHEVILVLSRVVCSMEHDLRSTMSSQKPGKTKQKSLLSWVKPQDTKVRQEDENV